MNTCQATELMMNRVFLKNECPCAGFRVFQIRCDYQQFDILTFFEYEKNYASLSGHTGGMKLRYILSTGREYG